MVKVIKSQEMGRQKYFHCTKCNNKHQRPGKNCTVETMPEEKFSGLDSSVSSSTSMEDNTGGASGRSQDTNSLLLQEMKSLSSKMNLMEKRLATTEKQLQASTSTYQQQGKSTKVKRKVPAVPQPQTMEEDSSDAELVMPSRKFIKEDPNIQQQVKARMEELKHINDRDCQGKFKSQRSVNDDVTVKFKIPWPQNQVLSGSNRSRPSYDQLNVFQWVSGFARFAQDESNIDVKNKMLEYLADLMEDAQDFSWASAKAAHAVALCRMEDGKLSWKDTQGLDRVRRAHAQKNIGASNSNNGGSGNKFGKNKELGFICKFFQIGTCTHSKDHVSGGRKYRHVCSHCQGFHPAKECKSNDKKSKNE